MMSTIKITTSMMMITMMDKGLKQILEEIGV